MEQAVRPRRGPREVDLVSGKREAPYVSPRTVLASAPPRSTINTVRGHVWQYF